MGLGITWRFVVIAGIITPLIWVITTVSLLLTPLITTHEPPSKGGPGLRRTCA